MGLGTATGRDDVDDLEFLGAAPVFMGMTGGDRVVGFAGGEACREALRGDRSGGVHVRGDRVAASWWVRIPCVGRMDVCGCRCDVVYCEGVGEITQRERSGGAVW